METIICPARGNHEIYPNLCDPSSGHSACKTCMSPKKKKGLLTPRMSSTAAPILPSPKRSPIDEIMELIDEWAKEEKRNIANNQLRLLLGIPEFTSRQMILKLIMDACNRDDLVTKYAAQSRERAASSLSRIEAKYDVSTADMICFALSWLQLHVLLTETFQGQKVLAYIKKMIKKSNTRIENLKNCRRILQDEECTIRRAIDNELKRIKKVPETQATLCLIFDQIINNPCFSNEVLHGYAFKAKKRGPMPKEIRDVLLCAMYCIVEAKHTVVHGEVEPLRQQIADIYNEFLTSLMGEGSFMPATKKIVENAMCDP